MAEKSRPELRLGLPKRRQWTWWAALLSLVLHSPLLLVRIQGYLPPADPRSSEVQLIPLTEEGPRAVDMPLARPQQTLGRGLGRRAGVGREEAPKAGPTPEVVEQPPIPLPPIVELADTGSRPATPEPTPVDVPRRTPRIAPALGEGKLWIRPLPLPPRELAQRLAKTHAELVDSAVSSIVQAYLDSVVASPTRNGDALPSWTTKIGNKTWGIDSKNIYLGDLKIPTAILALLPIGQGGNIDLRQAHRLGDIRADLQYAAQRAANMADFKRAVRELREKRERDREFIENQRKSPSDTTARQP